MPKRIIFVKPKVKHLMKLSFLLFLIAGICSDGDFFYGFDPMGNHHFAPPFGEYFGTCSNHLKQNEDKGDANFLKPKRKEFMNIGHLTK